MRIVVLDGATLNPGDLSWELLAAHGDLVVHERTPRAETVGRLRGATIALTNKAPIDAVMLAELPDLRYISVLATGTNIVDLAAARAQGIPVSNVPGYSTESVAQLTFALLLELTHRVGDHSLAARPGWASSADFSFTLQPLMELAGKQIAIVGTGAIGRAVAGIASAFGMRVAVLARESNADMAVDRLSWGDLLATSDVVSLHCPLTSETKGLIGPAELAQMKPGTMLLNTARGPLLDEAAVALALHEGRLGGAGLDVLSQEPPAPDNPLLTAPRCIITPHIAWASFEARQRLMAETVRNVQAFLDGTPRNVVN